MLLSLYIIPLFFINKNKNQHHIIHIIIFLSIDKNLRQCSLNVKIDKRGEALLIRFTSSLINDKYVKQDLLSKQFALLNEFINHPIFEDDIKARKLFNEVKEILVLNINTINDDPISYASNKANELFGDMLANKAIYSQEDVNKLSFEHLKQIYDQMIKKMAVDIFVLGDVDKEEIKKLALQYFNYPSRDTTKSLVHLSHREDHLLSLIHI